MLKAVDMIKPRWEIDRELSTLLEEKRSPFGM